MDFSSLIIMGPDALRVPKQASSRTETAEGRGDCTSGRARSRLGDAGNGGGIESYACCPAELSEKVDGVRIKQACVNRLEARADGSAELKHVRGSAEKTSRLEPRGALKIWSVLGAKFKTIVKLLACSATYGGLVLSHCRGDRRWSGKENPLH